MAINLSTLAGKLASVNVEFMGFSTKVTFDPLVITAENVTKVQNGGDDDFIDFFVKCIKNWDVTKGNKKVPLTKTGINGVPLPLLRAIYFTILSEAGDEEQGKASNGG